MIPHTSEPRIVIRQLGLEEIHLPALSLPLHKILHGVLHLQPVHTDVRPGDHEAVTAESTVRGAVAVVVVSMPEPGVVDCHLTPINLHVHISAWHKEEALKSVSYENAPTLAKMSLSDP
eukprot:CAMPEP_0204458048 /NCGR_PEP_ID=MMETSP0471-20130131/3226_1 /ASSEMBLY_ACC=CAM_ASM_000602 /TAXON_ID=2969 /ORGANISM="Oxyrrhis marina" /LENGTH=118 /DNA_ID=CAMNT_0051458595 /DNA_START=186 /DNA_END=540 /DNA_ORIENTATION=+